MSFKYKGGDLNQLLNPNNYPLSFGEEDLEVTFNSISDNEIKWAKDKIQGKESIKNLNKEIMLSSKLGSSWRLMILSELTRKNITGAIKKTNLNANNNSNFCAIINASIKNKVDCVKILITKNVNLDAIDNNATALIHAADKGHLNIVKLLVKNGSDISILDFKAIGRAKYNRHHDIAKYLSDCIGAEYKIPTPPGHESIPQIQEDENEDAKPKQDKEALSKWTKMNDYMIAHEVSSNENNTTIKSVFNFASKRIDKTIYEIEADGSKFVLLSDSQNFKVFESQEEINIAEKELIQKGGVIPNSKTNKTTGLIERPAKGINNV